VIGRGEAVSRGLGLGRAGRLVDQQCVVTRETDATDADEVGRRSIVATDVVPGVTPNTSVLASERRSGTFLPLENRRYLR
jgi:hypothetical protein